MNHDYAVAVTAGIECMVGEPLQWLRGFVHLAAQRPSVGPLPSLWEDRATQLLIELQLRYPGLKANRDNPYLAA